MQNKNVGTASMNNKRVWTEPKINIILLQAAKHGTDPGTDHPGGSFSKS